MVKCTYPTCDYSAKSIKQVNAHMAQKHKTWYKIHGPITKK